MPPRQDGLAVSDPSPPSSIVNPPPQPLFSVRRLVIVLVLVAAGAILVWSFRGTTSTGGGSACATPAVVGFDPAPGGRVLRQAQVGVELRPGYDGRISIDGREIPQEQMAGAVLPGTEAYDQLSAQERRLGPRPNNKNVVKFQPGPGKVVTRFSGQLEITIRYWRQSEGPGSAEACSYTVFVT